jgi:AAA+ superfamily predicted ATPase
MPVPVPVLDEIFRPYREGQPAVLLTDRSLFDLIVDEDGKIRPVIEALRRECQQRYGMACITYALATGLEWTSIPLDNDTDRRTIESALRAHQLLDIPQGAEEVVRVIRGIASLSRIAPTGLKWADGRDMRFAFLLLFGEHLTPGNLQNGTQSDPQLIAIELAHITAQSLALRTSANYVMFHGDDGLIDGLVRAAVRHICLCQPNREEKARFLDAALGLYSQATIDPSLGRDVVANLTANTPNRGLESLLRASHRTGTTITSRDLMRRKTQDVEQLSEGTLTLLDTDHVDDTDLAGRNVETARRVLRQFSEGLLTNNQHMPANVLLAGPPGPGKTQLTKLTAREGHAAAYLLNSPKSPYVGQTEHRAPLQQRLLVQWAPTVGLCDEITESFPLERSDFDGDSGASRAVMAALLTSLSDEGRRGKSLLVATTNCPWRMGAAMRSRFTVIPMLHPLREDFPAIIVSIAKQVHPGTTLSPQDLKLQSAAGLLYTKGANPRHIRAALSNALLLRGRLDEDAVVWAAEDFCASTDLASAVYADYWAIKCCVSKALFPWADDPSAYPFPAHLVGLVDQRTGDVDRVALEQRIAEVRPHANL